MLYALDTEFIEDGSTIDLISIGLVAEDGREYYRQNLDCDLKRANPWVIAHVYPYLESFQWYGDSPKMPYSLQPYGVWQPEYTLRREIVTFVGDSPTFVGYYSAYDWVVLCQLFGHMSDLPTGWPMYCIDLRAQLDERHCQHITQPDDMPHHALSDAKWIIETYKALHIGQFTWLAHAKE